MSDAERLREGQQLRGQVAQVVFRNEENGYTVLRLYVVDEDTGEVEETTVVGCLPDAAPGEKLIVTGKWMRHASYGAQFKAETVEHILPEGANAILEYLSSGAIPGVRAATARKLVDAFGDETLEVMERDPDRMAALPGISPKRARDISDAFLKLMGMRRLLDFLRGHGLPADLALPLYRSYGDRALERVKDNPYLLTQGELAVPFQAADALAVSLGLPDNDPQRLEAALLFELSHNATLGHVFLPADKLLDATARLLSLESPDVLLSALDDLTARRAVVRETAANVDAVYLTALHEDEAYVALRLEEMGRTEFTPPDDLPALMQRIQREQGITYAPQQQEAVALAARSQVMLLTGGPGTGKTTSLRGFLALFDALGLDTALAAPTGRAAKRLGETCGQEAYTIHRLLEAHFDDRTGQLVFSRNQQDPLKVHAVIVDETSMVDISLMASLLRALPGTCRLVLVGDPDQLPSVGPGAVLSDLLKSKTIPAVALTQIFRQAAKSAIIRSAHEINHGLTPSLLNRDRDFFFLRRSQSQKVVDTILELIGDRLPNRMNLPSRSIQVLSATRKGVTGTINLNKALQQTLNPPAPGKPEKPFGAITFRLGDRVMQIKNNYDVMWLDPKTRETGLGVFNGDIGVISAMEPDGSSLTVDFDGRQVQYPPDALGELELAYAITVHKAQGSEYPGVLFACMEAAPMLLTRGVLYTAVTRARTLFVAIGDERIFERMVANNRPQRRYTALKARLTGT